MTRWQEIMPEKDRTVYEKAGMHGRRPFGRNPALLIVDVTLGFIGRKPEDVLQSVKEFTTSCGDVGWDALPYIKRLLDSGREKQLPVVFTRSDPIARKFVLGVTKGAGKAPRADFDPERDNFPDLIAPLANEYVVEKPSASAFFATPLVQYLHQCGVDSLLVAGATTSGCVRASVVDAHSYGFRVFLVEECVFDRAALSHLVNLFEMNAKYADVITLDEAIEHLRGLAR